MKFGDKFGGGIDISLTDYDGPPLVQIGADDGFEATTAFLTLGEARQIANYLLEIAGDY